MEQLDIPLIRAAFTIRQGLDDKPPWKTVPEAVHQIAAVQIDTISVVARSHHLTLRNRVQNYRPNQVWTALRNGKVFEHFAHACCVVPIEEYPYYRHRMHRFPTHGNTWEKNLYAKYKELMDVVEHRIRNEGPLSSKDFDDSSKKKRGGFWDWKPAKVALDLLWHTGRLAVIDRIGFQRVYDLPERVIPSKYLDHQVDQDEVWRHFLQRNLDCLIASTAKDLTDYITFRNFALDITGNRTKTLEEKLQILIQDDLVTQVDVPKIKTPYYILTRNLPFIHKIQDRRSTSDRVWFLNPFDNILWNRARVQRLFDFEVKLEAYTPPAQRQFGYYVTPILWQHQIIGRIDPKADRNSNTLIIHNIELTKPRKQQPVIIPHIKQELERFKEFHTLEKIRINKTTPRNLKTQLSN
ncbi:MAG: winged helix-turn-helix domain-containing protein [Candidatus Hermodarchaeota archaeon]